MLFRSGIEVLRDGVRTVHRASREVVLCAGAIQSPQILELSGVGQGERLQRLGIPVLADSPHVGENMVDHLQVRCTYETTLPITINDVMRSFWHRMKVGAQYAFTIRVCTACIAPYRARYSGQSGD